MCNGKLKDIQNWNGRNLNHSGEKFVTWCKNIERFRADRVVLLVMDFTGLAEIKERLCQTDILVYYVLKEDAFWRLWFHLSIFYGLNKF